MPARFELILGHTGRREPMVESYGLSWSPDGERVAVAGLIVDEDTVASPGDAWIETWLVDRGGVHRSTVEAAWTPAWHPSGEALLTGGPVTAWRVKLSGRGWAADAPFEEAPNDGSAGRLGLCWSPDGGWVAAGLAFTKSRGRTAFGLGIWRADGKLMRVRKRLSQILDLDWGERGLVALCADGKIRVWADPAGDARPVEWIFREGAPRNYHGTYGRARWSPDGRWLAAVGLVEDEVRLFDEQGERRLLEGHGDAVRCLAWSPDGRLLATGSRDHTVRVWQVLSGQVVASLSRADVDEPKHLAWSVGHVLVAMCERSASRYHNVLRGWDASQLAAAPDPGPGATPPAVPGLTWTRPAQWTGVALSKDGADVFAASGGVLVRRSAAGETERWRTGCVAAESTPRLTLSVGGGELAVATRQEPLTLHDTNTGEVTHRLQPVFREPGVTAAPSFGTVAWSADRRYLVAIVSGWISKSASSWFEVQVFDLETQELCWWRGFDGLARLAAPLANGQVVVSMGPGIWGLAVATGEEVWSAVTRWPHYLCWRPEGGLTEVHSSLVRLRSPTGTGIWTQQHPYTGDSRVAWRADGAQLAVALDGGTVLLRDAGGAELRRWQAHADDITGLAWSGARLLTCGDDQRLCVWMEGALVAEARVPRGQPRGLLTAGSTALCVGSRDDLGTWIVPPGPEG